MQQYLAFHKRDAESGRIVGGRLVTMAKHSQEAHLIVSQRLLRTQAWLHSSSDIAFVSLALKTAV